MKHQPIVRIASKLLVPFIVLFALYVQFHGDLGPGGGFQAGVILASAVMLYGLVFGLKATQRAIPGSWLRLGTSLGVLIYGGVGVVCLLNGELFLDYRALAHEPTHGQHWGIFLVELGVGITVASVMVSIFYAFAGRGESR